MQVEITREIVDHPERWTGARVVDEKPMHIYDGDDAEPSQDVRAWLRNVRLLCDLETHLQMAGLLGRWENGSREDLDVVCAALLKEAVDVLGPGQVNASGDVNSVSSFTQRDPEMTDEQLAQCRSIEDRLALNGADLRSALIAHADSGLAGMQRSA